MFTNKKIGHSEKKLINTWWNIKKSISWLLRSDLKPRLRQKRWKFYYIFLFLILIFSVYSVLRVSLYAFDINSNSIVNYFLDSYAEIKKDENWFVNILLIWNWWKNHDWADLTDTMILLSVDLVKKSVVLLSIPRDLYVCYERPKYPCSRINEIYRDMESRYKAIWINEGVAEEQARWQLIKEVSSITDMDIHYYTQIDFQWFERVVDLIWWVTIDIPSTIIDNSYPDWNWWYEIFKIEKWIQNLNWKTALKYVRSRHSTSDFDRSARQQLVINAIKENVLNSLFFVNPYKIKDFIWIASENFITNFRISQMLLLALQAKDFDKQSMYSAWLHDDWERRWWFLGTPPRSQYWWAFVLIPYTWENDYSKIKVFTDIIFKNRSLAESKIEVLNSTLYWWYATKVARRFERYWMTVSAIWNSKELLNECEVRIFTNKIDQNKLLWYWKSMFPWVKLNIVDKVWYYTETDIDAEFLIGKNIKF